MFMLSVRLMVQMLIPVKRSRRFRMEAEGAMPWKHPVRPVLGAVFGPRGPCRLVRNQPKLSVMMVHVRAFAVEMFSIGVL